jgi:excisionase family DNA binding protein
MWPAIDSQTYRQAAYRLSVSLNTVRRKIARGELKTTRT